MNTVSIKIKINFFFKNFYFFVILNINAIYAASSAALLAQTGIGDKAALGVITSNMCTLIAKEHGYTGCVSAISSLAGVMGAAAAGVQTATTVITIIPGAGNAVNATVAYGITELFGRLLDLFYESAPCKEALKKGDNLGKGFASWVKTVPLFKEIVKDPKARDAIIFVIQKAAENLDNTPIM